MSEEPEVTATFKSAVIVNNTIIGQIFGDRKRRFEDGDYVRTSKIVSHSGDIYTTQNNVYRVERVETAPFS